MSRPDYTQQWSLPAQASIARVHNQLQAIPSLDKVNSYNIHIIFLDTPDCRLYRKGWSVQASGHDKQWQLTLNELKSGKLLAVAPANSLPKFSSDFPSGILRNKLSKPIYPRALITVCELRLKRREYVYLNDQGKQYLRLFLDQVQACQPEKQQTKKLPNYLVVEPLRGYVNEANKFISSLVKQLDLQEEETSLLTRCLAIWNNEPNLKASKLDTDLYHDESTQLGLRRIYLSLLEIMCANEDGLTEQIDTEFLHDFRIAVRKTRSLLGQSKKVIAPDILQEFSDEFAWLGALTGPARDYDVMLLEFSDYQALLPDYNAADFAALENYLRQVRGNAYKALIEAIGSDRYAKFKKRWREFLEKDDLMYWEAAAQQTISEFGNQHISHVYNRVITEGKNINPESPVDAYHQLRKSCKKLRYLLEMLRNLYKPKKVKRAIKALKQLQDNLGELQDLEVHIEILQEFLLQKRPDKMSSQSSGNAIQQLIDWMSNRKLVVISDFHKAFCVFSNKKNKDLMTELLEVKKR